MEYYLLIIFFVVWTWLVFNVGKASGIHIAQAIVKKLVKEHQQKITLDNLYGRDK